MVILVGGASHTGKSTVARRLAERLGGTSQSTDALARHPGRPWAPPTQAVRPHVVEHYRHLSHDERMASVLAHYRAMRPLIEDAVSAHLVKPGAGPLVLEGSALLPETVAAGFPEARAVWIIADAGLLKQRIEAESGYARAEPGARQLIEAFLERACRFDAFLREQLQRLDLPAVHVTEALSPEEVTDLCWVRARPARLA